MKNKCVCVCEIKCIISNITIIHIYCVYCACSIYKIIELGCKVGLSYVKKRRRRKTIGHFSINVMIEYSNIIVLVALHKHQKNRKKQVEEETAHIFVYSMREDLIFIETITWNQLLVVFSIVQPFLLPNIY